MSVLRPVRILIGGVDRTEYIRVNSLKITKGRNRRASADAMLEVLATGYAPPVGAPIEISTYDEFEEEITDRHFTGLIHSKDAEFNSGTDYVVLSLRCLDLTAIMDRRVCLDNFPVQDPPRDAAGIAAEIVSRFLDGEDINSVELDDGYLVETDLPFKNRSVRECLDRLSTLSGSSYFIDETRGFHFSRFLPSLAPFNIEPGSNIWRRPTVRESLERYRNVQRIQTDQPFESTEIMSWPMRSPSENTFWYPNSVQLDNAPAVSVDGIPKTVGAIFSPIGPYPHTHDFYYLPGTFGVYVDDLSAWGPPNVISISAGPVMANSVVRTNDAEIEVRRSLEGGSGRHEAVEDQRDMNTEAQLVAYADGLLRRHSRIPKEIEFETDEGGLEPGQRIQILYPLLGIGWFLPPAEGSEWGEDEFGNPIFGGSDEGAGWIAGEYLIESVTYTLTVGRDSDFMRTVVKCSDAELIGTSLDFMARILEMARLGKPATSTTGAVTATY